MNFAYRCFSFIIWLRAQQKCYMLMISLSPSERLQSSTKKGLVFRTGRIWIEVGDSGNVQSCVSWDQKLRRSSKAVRGVGEVSRLKHEGDTSLPPL